MALSTQIRSCHTYKLTDYFEEKLYFKETSVLSVIYWKINYNKIL